MEKSLTWLMSMAALVLVACSSGGSGDDGEAAPLATELDVLHEIAALNEVSNFVTRSLPDSGTAGNGVTAKADSATSCSGEASGGSANTKSRDFLYFNAPQTSVSYNATTTTNCSYSQNYGDSTYTYFENGSTEWGESTGTVQGARLNYSLLGSPSSPYTSKTTQSQGSRIVTEATISGYVISEARRSSSVQEQAELSRIHAFGVDRNGAYDSTVSIGEDSTPFRQSKALPGGALTLNGSYHRETECVTGRVAVFTPTALTATYSSSSLISARMTGGVLRLSSGGKTATVTFNSDGSARYQIEGGISGTVTSGTIEAALNGEGEGCDGL